MKKTITPAKARPAPKAPSKLERRFDLFWRGVNGPPLVAEYRFDAVRKWRFDRAHLATKTAIELEGGVWSGGAHTRGGHYLSDCEKYNAAALQGWTVVRLATGMIRVPILEQVREHINNQAVQCLSVGGYRLNIGPGDKVWLLNPIGEGMETSVARVELYLAELFRQEF